jgi:hypothetical protein
MIRREGAENAFRRLLRVAVACLVVVGLAQSAKAGASGDPGGFSGALILSSLKPSVEADSHHPAVGHGSAEHCLSGSGCTSAAVLPEAAVLPIGKSAPTLIRADVSAHCWNTLPPLHPPNSANLG